MRFDCRRRDARASAREVPSSLKLDRDLTATGIEGGGEVVETKADCASAIAFGTAIKFASAVYTVCQHTEESTLPVPPPLLRRAFRVDACAQSVVTLYCL